MLTDGVLMRQVNEKEPTVKSIAMNTKAIMNAFADKEMDEPTANLARHFYEAARRVEIANDTIKSRGELITRNLLELGNGGSAYYMVTDYAIEVDKAVIERNEATKLFYVLAEVSGYTVEAK